MRKGQLAIAILIAGVMLTFVFLGLYINKLNRVKDSNAQMIRADAFDSKMLRVGKGVESCLEKVSFDGLLALGRHGGWIMTPPKANYRNRYTYWYLDETNVQPTMEEVRLRLVDYIHQNMANCVTAEALNEEIVNITLGIPRTNVSFDAESVSVKLYYPMTFRKSGAERSFETFEARHPLRFRRMFELATQVNTRIFDPDFMYEDALRNVTHFGMNASYTILPDPIEDSITKVLLFNITDPENIVEGRRDFAILFAARFYGRTLPRLVDEGVPGRTGNAFDLYSLDKRSALHAIEDPFLESPGVINITQAYPRYVTRTMVPTEVENGEVQKRENFAYTELQYPMYTLSPAALLTLPRTWTFNWDTSQTNPHLFPNPTGEIGVLFYDGMNWEPIPSSTNKIDGYIQADISSLGSLVVADCAFQASHMAKTTKKKSEGQSCITFIPLCDQTITIEKQERMASGQCRPNRGDKEVSAGVPVELCVTMHSCNDPKRKSCEVECKTEYR